MPLAAHKMRESLCKLGKKTQFWSVISYKIPFISKKMESKYDAMNGKSENEILFSRTIKAGKRVYYTDIKCDRRGELYLAVTESKRIKDGTEDNRPVFEKHKIFVYREDLEKFMDAINAAAQFARENAPYEDEEEWGEANHYDYNARPAAPYYPQGEEPEAEKPADFKLDIDF